MVMLPFQAISFFNQINGSTSHLELGQLLGGTHYATCVVTFDDVAQILGGSINEPKQPENL